MARPKTEGVICYTDPGTPAGQTLVRATHIAELRAAVLALR